MTTDQEQKSAVIASYMGAKFHDIYCCWFMPDTAPFPDGSCHHIAEAMLYHSDIYWIYPVWIRATHDPSDIDIAAYSAPYFHAKRSLLDGDIPELFNSLYDCIKIINKTK